ncbi:MAG: radical SAM protein [Lachnospiraceae bacterium]|nr:radical SAM protein [Lachnospiraceae bacterium]
MRSPADMQTIQVDITNACNKRCSNCTRFCGNHNKSFFMDYDTFKRAIDSLDGYTGVVGVMGGEPTLHPQFERFVAYIREKFGERKEQNRLIYPQKNFIKEVRRREFESHVLRQEEGKQDNFRMCGPGLWSNMGASYRKYYELAQDTFNVQFLNDHINSSYHQPGLFSRKDLGISDEEWIPMRDKCWIQNEWSATITPKGAFFCEIAGALDMLFDGPGGWKIEPGWWKRTPEEFGDQLHWCEICGFALDTFMRDAEEETDDVSPTLYKMLEEIGSPRLKAGRINLVKIENGVIAEESKAPGKHFSAAQPYIEHYEDRFNANNSILFIHEYDKVVIPEGNNFGKDLNKAIDNASEWIVYSANDEFSVEDIDRIIEKNILNPGTLHIGKECLLFSKNALSLRKIGFDRIAYMTSFEEVIKMWDPKKVISLDEVDNLVKWKRDAIIAGKKYIIWGTGLSGSFIADAVESSGGNLLFAIDSDCAKEEKDFYGVTTHLPEYLIDKYDEFDYMIIGHYSRFEEIKDQALKIGVPEEKILLPYEI